MFLGEGIESREETARAFRQTLITIAVILKRYITLGTGERYFHCYFLPGGRNRMA